MNIDIDIDTDTPVTSTSTSTSTSPAAVIAMVAEARAAKVAKATMVDYDDPESFPAAQARLTAAYEALRGYFAATEWGANGCTFVTRRKQHVGDHYLQTLRVQGRPVATCTEDGWVKVISSDESEKLRAGEIEVRRACHKARVDEREQLIRSLVQHNILSPKNFAEWFYADGENGGCFFRLGRANLPVAAIGVMKAADKERNRQFVGSEPRPEDFFDLQEQLFPAPRRRGRQ